IVDPALLRSTIRESAVVLAQSGQLANQLVRGGAGVERCHLVAIEGITAAISVVVKELLVAIVDDWNSARGQQKSCGFVEAIGVVVDGKEAGNVVAVDEGDQVILPGEVRVLGIQ